MPHSRPPEVLVTVMPASDPPSGDAARTLPMEEATTEDLWRATVRRFNSTRDLLVSAHG